MKYITTMNTLLGKHNVTSNQADWQFGSSRFSRLCLWLFLPNPSASQMTSVSVAKNGCYSNHLLTTVCYLIRWIDRSSKHLNIVNLTLINSTVSLNKTFLCLLSVSCPLVGSLCQFDSPVLLWTGCDNGTLPAICNPPFDSPLWIMHYNHNLTNLLGIPIYKNPKWNSQNSDSDISLADRTTVICCQGLFLPSRLSLSLCSALKAFSGQLSNHYRWDRTENNADAENQL